MENLHKPMLGTDHCGPKIVCLFLALAYAALIQMPVLDEYVEPNIRN
jgi:hypothetical protein